MWNQNSSHARTPGRDTTVTYAATMTDWQATSNEQVPSFAQHRHQQRHQHQHRMRCQQHQQHMQEQEHRQQERHNTVMDLSRIISHLAIANQQLSTTHNATLLQLEDLYVELEKERKLRWMDSQSERLENPAESRLYTYQDTRSNVFQGTQSSEEPPEGGGGGEGGDVEDDERQLRRKERNTRIGKVDEEIGNGSSCSQCYRKHHDGHSAINQTSTNRTEALVTTGRNENAKCQAELTCHNHLRATHYESDAGKIISSDICTCHSNLSHQNTETLCTNLSVRDRLTDDCEISTAACDRLEATSDECEKINERFEEDPSLSNKEAERLSKELSDCQSEKCAANDRISNLERQLQESLAENERILTRERKTISDLEARLSEEVSDKNKQLKTLENAFNEIERMKGLLTVEKTISDSTSKEDIAAMTEISSESHEVTTVDRITNLEEFKKELSLKREARQRAIAAVSSEMERLRRDLDAEKKAHFETARVLDLLKSAQPDFLSDSNGNCQSLRRREQQQVNENEMSAKRTEAQQLTSILKVSDELRNDIRCQIEKVDDLRYQLETEPDQHRFHIRYLTEVTNRTREAVNAREKRANELKDHLAQILVRMGDRRFLDQKDDVGDECERQLENVNTLKLLYNERLKILTGLKDTAVKELADVKDKLEHSLKKCESLEDDLKKAEGKVDAQDTEISNLESQLGLTKADCRDLQNQVSLINGLFTQMLLGASSADMDLDRLTRLLQENHDLICDMAREEGTEAAALPKLLLDLVEQVEGGKGNRKQILQEDETETSNQCERKDEDLQQENIAHNLPKVWRVLFELLSCHAVGTPSSSIASSSDPNSCYKSVDTPAGPRLVISVSKTYIRLKELILEKKHLEREMNRMKQLNVHLESKLGEQEKRLSAVSDELSKTWSIVGRMQAQHQQLHTHEKILRYELQQKRKMLQELKQELEYCREKWESARQKNTNTEIEWRSLRREFAARKALAIRDSFNNSAESGFSDERCDDTDEEDEEYEEDDDVAGRIRLGPRARRTRKVPKETDEDVTVPLTDTESEQPTDTELSSEANCITRPSLSSLDERTPTPETEAEVEAELTADAETLEPQKITEDLRESLDPLDRALTNVIQNLIRIKNNPETACDSATSVDSIATSFQYPSSGDVLEKLNNLLPPDVTRCPAKEIESPAPDSLKNSVEGDVTNASINNDSQQKSVRSDQSTDCVRVKEISAGSATANTISIFSIGPFPPPITFKASSTINARQVDDITLFGRASWTAVEPVDSKESEEKRSSKAVDSVADSDDVSVDSSSSLDTVKEYPTGESTSSVIRPRLVEDSKLSTEASSSLQQTEPKKPVRTPAEALAARADRLRRLEEQANSLMKRMSATSRRGSALCTRLEELHEVYGEAPTPPPMPDVLPTRRLRTVLPIQSRQRPVSSSSAQVGVDSSGTSCTEKRHEPPSNDAP